MKFFCFSSKPFKIVFSLVICLLFVCLLLDFSGGQTVFFGYTKKKVPIYSVETQNKNVALTFDAAWGADKTKDILKILKEKGVDATFFLVGFWVEKYPDMVKSINEAGIDIGTHSNTHPKMSTLTDAHIRNELKTSMDLITKITGKSVRFFRPPFGDYNDRLLSICDELKLQTIQWSVDSLDWKGLSSSQILTRVLQSVDNGGIILFHNNSDHIVEALPIVIDSLKQRGFNMVKLSDLVYPDNYTINSNGVQIKNI